MNSLEGYENVAKPPHLPGFGLPLNYVPKDGLFPNALIVSDVQEEGRGAQRLTTLREFTMLRLMNQLTDKPDWDKKVFDESITTKWRAEALAAENTDVTEEMIDYCIAELQYKAKKFPTKGFVAVYNGDVVKSDVAIPFSLQEALKLAVAPLEDVPEREKDWHPGSDEKVLDLVHPSLFPLIYGRSRALKAANVSLDECVARCGEGEVIPVPTETEAEPGKAIERHSSPRGGNGGMDTEGISDYEVIEELDDVDDEAEIPEELLKTFGANQEDDEDAEGEDEDEDENNGEEEEEEEAEDNDEDEENGEEEEEAGDNDDDEAPEQADDEDNPGSDPWEHKPYSRKFQWLPCEVDISGEGDSVRITSYINNLHPQAHKPLYSAVEQIIARAIPLWNATLTPLKTPNSSCERIPFSTVDYDPDPENAPETEGPQQRPDEDEDDYWERREEWITSTRRVVMPEPSPFVPPHEHEATKKYFEPETGELKPESGVDLRKEYSDKGLQVIVKLANIQLTPEEPEYEGGSWHVEGQLNEHICATALYYYDNENITSSSLAFRQQSDTDTIDINYPQNAHDWLQIVFGCENEEAAVQEIGAVDTREGRLITFPNVLQHQVQPFKLVDSTKPGHRKILALFLVDPHIRVISTAHVPPQQKEWWTEAVRQNKTLKKLPVELQKLVEDAVEEFPISLEEAKKLRLKLMEERKRFVREQGSVFEGNEFSLCEH
ncbi:hypothetical protein BDQ12DRAFT_725248 [Crucibulum laeve]|uniref:Uncharacterized protein n=1 Tax=Crucibulum laeve TaxID=68775 RepID=A0A5C3LUY0_9AGAR|nr:hypothetical protein BDQ12DRAFT_725248 [Crucibulum laeve]